MSARPPLPERLARLIEVGPVLAAFAVHAIGHGRWILALPAAAALVLFVDRGWSLRSSERRFAAAGAIGAAIGLALVPLFPPPAGPIPGFLLSPICGLLLATGFWCAATRKALYAWLYAWLLAILSANGEPGLGLYAALVALGASTLAAAYGQGRLGQSGLPGAIAACLCAAAIAAGAVAGAEGIKASEGFLVEHVGGAIYDWVNKSGLQPRLGLQEIVSLPRRSTGQQSSRALLEIEGAGQSSRLRTVVLDHFDGDSWSTSGSLGERLLMLPGASREARAVELLFLAPLGGRIPSPAGTADLRGAPAEVRGGWVLLSDRLEGREVELSVEPGERLPPEPAPGPELLALPEELRAEIEPIARQVTAGTTTSEGRARALERFFQANFTYSLEADLSGPGHPLAILVRQRRPAYCVYFAGAMAAMLRSLGIPARMVGGFVAENPNPLTGRALVRERDAHAWVEAWIAEQGRYVAFDPTPFDSRDAALGLERQGKLGALLEAAGSWLRRAWNAVWRDPMVIARSPLSWILLAAALGWWIKRRRWIGGSRREESAKLPEDARLAALHRRYLRLLRRWAAVSASPAETDQELLERLEAARGIEARRLAEAFLEQYRGARFGARGASAEELGALLAGLEEAAQR